MWSNIWNVSYIELRIWNQVSSDHSRSLKKSEVQTPLKSWLFQASIRNCLNCVHNCDDHSLLDFKSAVQYMKHFIYYFTSILHGLIRTHKWPAPNVSGFIAQLVRASDRYREVTGSNPVEVLTFSGFYIMQLLKLNSELRWSQLTWVVVVVVTVVAVAVVEVVGVEIVVSVVTFRTISTR